MSKPTRLESVRIQVEHWKQTAKERLESAEEDAAAGSDEEGNIRFNEGQVEAFEAVLSFIEKSK